jgi:hypothetical protein
MTSSPVLYWSIFVGCAIGTALLAFEGLKTPTLARASGFRGGRIRAEIALTLSLFFPAGFWFQIP